MSVIGSLALLGERVNVSNRPSWAWWGRRDTLHTPGVPLVAILPLCIYPVHPPGYTSWSAGQCSEVPHG